MATAKRGAKSLSRTHKTLAHTHTHTHTHSLCNASISHTHTLALSLTHTLSISLSPTLSFSYAHSLCLPHTQSLTHSLYKHAHTLCIPRSLSLVTWKTKMAVLSELSSPAEWFMRTCTQKQINYYLICPQIELSFNLGTV